MDRLTLLTALAVASAVSPSVAHASDAIWDFASFTGSMWCEEDYTYLLDDPPKDCHDESHVDIIAAEGAITQTTAACSIPETEGRVELTTSPDGDFYLRAYAFSFEFRPEEFSDATTEVNLVAPFTVNTSGNYELRFTRGYSNWWAVAVNISDDSGVLASLDLQEFNDNEGYTAEDEALPVTLLSDVVYRLGASLDAGPGDEWPNEATLEDFDLVLLSTPTVPNTWTELKSRYRGER